MVISLVAAGVEGVAEAVPVAAVAAGSTAAGGTVVVGGIAVGAVGLAAVAGGTTAAGTLADFDSLPQPIAPVTEPSINAVPSATVRDVKLFMPRR